MELNIRISKNEICVVEHLLSIDLSGDIIEDTEGVLRPRPSDLPIPA